MKVFLLVCCVLFLGLPSRADDLPLTSGIDRTTFDTTVAPGTDFFEYVNGNWNKQNPIPPEYSRWGAFMKLRDDNLTALRMLLEDLNKPGVELDENQRKLRDFYATSIDDAKLDSQGSEPLRDELEAIAQDRHPREAAGGDRASARHGCRGVVCRRCRSG